MLLRTPPHPNRQTKSRLMPRLSWCQNGRMNLHMPVPSASCKRAGRSRGGTTASTTAPISNWTSHRPFANAPSVLHPRPPPTAPFVYLVRSWCRLRCSFISHQSLRHRTLPSSALAAPPPDRAGGRGSCKRCEPLACYLPARSQERWRSCASFLEDPRSSFGTGMSPPARPTLARILRKRYYCELAKVGMR